MRILAMVYDTLVIFGIWMLTIVLLVTVNRDVVYGAWLQSVLYVELFAFFAYFWMNRGQTIGMLAWRLRIVGTTRISFITVLLRFVGALAGAAFFFVGYAWILFDPQRRSWSDLLSRTQVVREPKPDQNRTN